MIVLHLECHLLCDILRNQNHKFPKNFSPSLRSLLDRFEINPKDTKYISSLSESLFGALRQLHKLEDEWLLYLKAGAKLINIGTSLNFYSHRHHSHYLILNNLDYGFTHIEKLLIASIVKYHGKRFTGLDKDGFEGLLRKYEEQIKWLSMMLSIAEAISVDKSKTKIEFEFDGEILQIKTDKKLFLGQERLKALLKGSGLIFNVRS